MEYKTCIFDIDGVLNYYPQCYIDFVNKELGLKLETLDVIKTVLSQKDYKALKYKYRTCGIKEELKVRQSAKDLMYKLKQMGYYIIVLSSRPVDKINALIMQTTNWLKDNGIDYDYLMFGENKHLDIIQKFGNVEFVVEDNRAFANNIAKHGNQVFLINNDCNKGKLVMGVHRICHLNEIVQYLDEEEVINAK